MDSQVMVSVVCNAYNHEKYIKQCLDGLVMQKTDFIYEILVHDDASTDKTADIIRSYEKQYPHLIKPIYQTENQYSKGGIYRFQYPRAKGKYIAFCEGDDYWTDENKLQRQVDVMEAHPEVDMCAHTADVISEDGATVLRQIAPSQKQSIIPVEAVIAGGGGFVATNSILYRATLVNTEYEFRTSWRIDYTMQILGALRGGLLYLPEKMSAYRWMAIGSWTMRQSANREKCEETLNKKRRMLACLNSETDGKYDKTIRQTLLMEEFLFYYLYGPYKKTLEKQYREIFKRKSLKIKMKLWIKILFPFFFRQ